MKREEQYNALVEMVANARLLMAQSDTEEVVESVRVAQISEVAIKAVKGLGYSGTKFTSDSIERYKELLTVNGRRENGGNNLFSKRTRIKKVK